MSKRNIVITHVNFLFLIWIEYIIVSMILSLLNFTLLQADELSQSVTDLKQRLSRAASLGCVSNNNNNNSVEPVVTSTPLGSGHQSGPPSMTEDDVDRDFWNLVRKPLCAKR